MALLEARLDLFLAGVADHLLVPGLSALDVFLLNDLLGAGDLCQRVARPITYCILVKYVNVLLKSLFFCVKLKTFQIVTIE